jgi:hypothetical protein
MNMDVSFSGLPPCGAGNHRAKYLLWVHWFSRVIWKSQEFASEPYFLQALGFSTL